MFMYGNSGQNELNVSEKEELTPIYIREKNLVSRHLTCLCGKNKTVFIKNDVHILKLFLIVTEERVLFLFQCLQKKQTIQLWLLVV